MVETLAAGATVVGVRVRPGAAWPALGVPASDLVDRVIAADELWGAAAFELAERVAGAGSPSTPSAIWATTSGAGPLAAATPTRSPPRRSVA